MENEKKKIPKTVIKGPMAIKVRHRKEGWTLVTGQLDERPLPLDSGARAKPAVSGVKEKRAVSGLKRFFLKKRLHSLP